MSTAIELAGFACWVVAAFVWQSVALQTVTGLLVLGALLVFVGYSLDGIAVRPAVDAVWARLRALRGTKTGESASN